MFFYEWCEFDPQNTICQNLNSCIVSKDLRLKLHISGCCVFFLSGLIHSSWSIVWQRPTFWVDLKLELKPFLKRHKNGILLTGRNTVSDTKGGFRKTWKANYLYNQLWEKDQTVSCYNRCSKVTTLQAAEYLRCLNKPPLQALEDVWLWDFRAFQKYTKCRNTSLLCQNTSALCLYYIFPFYMLEIIRPLIHW